MKKKYAYLILFISILSIFFLIRSYDFSSSVRNETRKNLLDHKSFFKSLKFKGKVLKKEICSNCNINKYQIVIKLDSFDAEKVAFNNRTFPPYYKITPNEIFLTVNKEIFENVEINDQIIKSSGSNTIDIDSINLRLLNQSKYEWLSKNE